MYKTKMLLLFTAISVVSGCAKPQYAPDDFINPNKVVVKKIKAPLPKVKVATTYGYGNDPEIEKAYQRFLKTGKMADLHSEGFKTLAYNAHSRPILACEPLHLCLVQLETGENINNIELGDSAHWKIHTSLIGSSENGSYQIAVKPFVADASTDMVITTSKRTYNLGLVSQPGQTSQVVNFYYPEETLSNTIQSTHQLSDPEIKQTINTSPMLRVDQLNFNYRARGDRVAWTPVRIFDDGNKTFIQMPEAVQHRDLPVLYVRRQNQLALVNYRYVQPYYVIDGLINTAYLISGKGHVQQKIVIENRGRA